MNCKSIAAALLLCAATLTSTAQVTFYQSEEPLWQGKGRIALSSDGNEHDHDDWAATPLSLAILASQGLQDKMSLYTYSDHIWGSNQTNAKRGFVAYNEMRESALVGADMFGFDKSRFVCAVDNAEMAYEAMMKQINMSSAEDPLFIIAAGPMQVVGEALNRSDISKRKYVTIITHSKWNNEHSDNPAKNKWDKHTGWTYDEMVKAFEPASGGSCQFVRIVDQNRGKGYIGLNAPKAEYDWMKTSKAQNKYKKGSWEWLYSRLQLGIKEQGANYDPSDAGMALFLVTGVQKTTPTLVRELLENPKQAKIKKLECIMP